MKGSHSPQDELYGPIKIPDFCWEIIDTPEFQRLRYLNQLGPVQYVYPSAMHTRFEHCLGCAHLAGIFAEHFQMTQPELKLEQKHIDALILAALCHDIGHGPLCHVFDTTAHAIDDTWDHESMSQTMLRYIVKQYNINILPEVVDAACNFIIGEPYKQYPPWISQIVANKNVDVDVDKFDYLSRDMNRTLTLNKFEYERLIVNCRIIDNQLCWKISETPTIERLFYNRNDMHKRVYQHRVVQAIGLMLTDMLSFAEEKLNIRDALDDPKEFAKLDDRLFGLMREGIYGEKCQQIALDIDRRHLYRCIGELRVQPENHEGLSYSQHPHNDLEDDIASFDETLPVDVLRVVKMKFRYGLTPTSHPLTHIPFYRSEDPDTIIHLEIENISCIVPEHFAETQMRVFITDQKYEEKAKIAFQKWKKEKCYE